MLSHNLIGFDPKTGRIVLFLSREDGEGGRTWFFLDEVKESGHLRGLSRLMTLGRSKGAHCVLGFQDLGGLQAVYGREQANELVGQCGNKAILRLESPETAEWASKLFGDFEAEETRTSINEGGRSASTNQSVSGIKVHNILPSELLDLPPTSPKNGLTGFYHCPLIGSWSHRQTGPELGRQLFDMGSEPNFISRPEKDQVLVPAIQNPPQGSVLRRVGR